MDMEAGPSGISNETLYVFWDTSDEESDDESERKTDLDEFLESYKANPLCLLQILSFLDFDENGYNCVDNTPDNALENHPTVKRIFPLEGFCVRAITREACVVFVNICHCDDIQAPSNALLDTLLNLSDESPTVNLPLSLGKPHRELDYDGQICIAFDIILNSRFFEQQVNRYELLRAYVLSLCINGINDKYYNTILGETCQKVDVDYYGTMPKQYIDRRMSAFAEDLMMVKIYTQNRAARVLKWAKASALKRLQKLRNYEQRAAQSFRIRAPVRLRSRSRHANCKDCKPSTSGMRLRSSKSPAPQTSDSQGIFPPIRKEEIDSLRDMECVDMNGIVRIGIHVESDHLPYPTVIPPGSWTHSVDILNNLKADDPGYSLDYELFQLCKDGKPQYLAITKLPCNTKLEEIAVFASGDGIVVCDSDSKRYFEVSVPYPVKHKKIKITVNRLTMTLRIPVVFGESPCETEKDNQKVPSLSD